MSENKKSTRLWEHIVIFYISFLCICLELLFTRILNLKTFNHVVYVIIPFAILGYGIGANIFFLQSRRGLIDSRRVLTFGLIALAVFCPLSMILTIKLPLSVKLLADFFLNIQNAWILSIAYVIFMVPFVIIGYLILFLFSKRPDEISKLYFWDLLGAGGGALGFFFLIHQFQIVRSIILLSLLALVIAMMPWISRRKKWVLFPLMVLAFLLASRVPEINNYPTDNKGWENFPKYYQADAYETLTSRWHPLGRTDTYRLKLKERQEALYKKAEGTFQINLRPFPDFSYFSTNFLGGTPVYKLSDAGIKEYNSQVALFSQPMEFPYLFNNNPDVLVIGAGGGRDIFFAKTHGAHSILGAEINPEIYRQMNKTGQMYEYSGRIYDQPGIKVENIDGRNLTKRLANKSYDLIVLNGVDTYYGLSTGAYAYAESYLYTKDAIKDYYRILKDDGAINFNRWFSPEAPRETLRLFVIITEALQELGVKVPWTHLTVGHYNGWGMILVKKTPFSAQEYAKISLYFQKHESELIYPSAALFSKKTKDLNHFDLYTLAFRAGEDQEFIRNYAFDISAITDDNPFFYKYYRLRDFRPTKLSAFSNYGSGFVIFLTQGLVLFHAIVFSIIFIGLPLMRMKKDQLKLLSGRLPAFIIYFASLGVGFMFIEIPLMQKFTLLLGNPIYSISVTLAALLIFSGIGSCCIPWLSRLFKDGQKIISMATVLLAACLIGLNIFSAAITDSFIGLSFMSRIFVVAMLIAPMGFCLGIFFPQGLATVSKEIPETLAWAWGINAGFSVIGSMLSMIIAQFYGFKLIIWLALGLYVVAALCYQRLLQKSG